MDEIAGDDLRAWYAPLDPAGFDAMLATVCEPTRAWQCRRPLGQQVDVVPFGGPERDGEVVIHESSLIVLGCAEAAAYAANGTLPSGEAAACGSP